MFFQKTDKNPLLCNSLDDRKKKNGNMSKENRGHKSLYKLMDVKIIFTILMSFSD